MDFIEFVVEIMLEVYMELMLLVIPEKNVTRKHRVIATILAVCMLITVVALAVWGAILILDQNNLLGIIPLVISVLLSVFQIILGIVFYNKGH